MSANERREAILQALNARRSEKIENLAAEFGVTERTIRSDIEALTCCYPIKTKRGRYGGGVEVESWFHLQRRTLSPEQAELLHRVARTLDGHDLDTMNSILSHFAPY